MNALPGVVPGGALASGGDRMAWTNANWIALATPALRFAALDAHIAEVSAQIQASVAADGVSHNSQTLQAYLRDLMQQRPRFQREAAAAASGATAGGGLLLSGALR